jgi:hypothetical protein
MRDGRIGRVNVIYPPIHGSARWGALWKKGGGWMNRGWKNHEFKKQTSKQKNGGGNTRKMNIIGNEIKQQDQMQTLPAKHLKERKNR